MERFLVAAPHTAHDCVDALKQVVAIGFLTHFEWGCKEGNHTGWAIIEAENAAEAMMAVPTGQRHSASVVKLHRFSVSEIEKMHAK